MPSSDKDSIKDIKEHIRFINKHIEKLDFKLLDATQKDDKALLHPQLPKKILKYHLISTPHLSPFPFGEEGGVP